LATTSVKRAATKAARTVKKRKPATPRPVTITVTTTYRLTQAEYEEAVAATVEEMEQYRYGNNKIPRSTKTTVEGVK
jgi:hypothetical protein